MRLLFLRGTSNWEGSSTILVGWCKFAAGILLLLPSPKYICTQRYVPCFTVVPCCQPNIFWILVLSRLLKKLSQALETSGVDLSQANISVELDLGKGSSTAAASPAVLYPKVLSVFFCCFKYWSLFIGSWNWLIAINYFSEAKSARLWWLLKNNTYQFITLPVLLSIHD